jgi:hypothetical protein
MDDRGLWGRELGRIRDQVRSWPATEQRSAAIRGWSPQRHSAETPGASNTSQDSSGARDDDDK